MLSGGKASRLSAFGVDQVYVMGIGGGKAGVGVMVDVDMVRLVAIVPTNDEERDII